jgi:hypothetical protein
MTAAEIVFFGMEIILIPHLGRLLAVAEFEGYPGSGERISFSAQST